MKIFVITAGRTKDGAPVYLAEDGSWSTTLTGSRIFETEADAESSLIAARKQEEIVSDPGLFKVRREAEGLVPLTTKSRLRLEGAEALLARLGYFDVPDVVGRTATVGT